MAKPDPKQPQRELTPGQNLMVWLGGMFLVGLVQYLAAARWTWVAFVCALAGSFVDAVWDEMTWGVLIRKLRKDSAKDGTPWERNHANM